MTRFPGVVDLRISIFIFYFFTKRGATGTVDFDNITSDCLEFSFPQRAFHSLCYTAGSHPDTLLSDANCNRNHANSRPPYASQPEANSPPVLLKSSHAITCPHTLLIYCMRVTQARLSFF